MFIFVSASCCFPAYHCRCVDPWLTQTKKTCPVCKQRVTRPSPEHAETSDSEEDAGSRTDEEGAVGPGVLVVPTNEHSSERTPLLRSNPASPLSVSPPPATYASTIATVSAVTTVTTAQCLTHTPQRDSPLLGYDGYYSPQEDTDDGDDDEDEELEVDHGHPSDDDTAQLIGRGPVGV